MIPFLYQEREPGPVTFAAPDENVPFAQRLANAGRAVMSVTPAAITRSIGRDIIDRPGEFIGMFTAAERQTRLVDTAFSQDAAREEAYDRRIKAVKDATGITLENPERGGYGLTERDLRALSRDGPIDPVAHRRQMFDRELGKAAATNPDKANALTFGDIDDEAKAISQGADADYEFARRDSHLSTAGSLAAQFGGGLWGMRRDPLFVGSLFAGPSGAVGRSVAARIASSGLMQGLYNAGLTAIEQPAVQAWRSELGLKSGLQPALEHTGMAFLFGMIPGAALRGLHEATAARPAIQHVLAGNPEAGDIERAVKAAGSEMAPQETAAVKLGEDIDAADKATAPPKPKDVTPELHDDMTAAAMRKADDPVGSPSPEAVRFIEAYHGSPHDFEAFDIGRIGTGEGAQAYGHGLYFAESEGVARNYKDKLGSQNINSTARFYLQRTKDNKQKALAALDADYAKSADKSGYESIRREIEQGQGALYKVRINADKEHFLDWDKPLSEQPPNVLSSLQRIAEEMKPGAGEELAQSQTKAGDWLDVLGKGQEMSAKLREAGIPGIKYLDAGSRNAGDGSRNYVLFDDKLVDITHKNDTPIAREVAARVAAAAPQTEREAQMAASEAIEDIGNRQSGAATRTQLDTERMEPPLSVKTTPSSQLRPDADQRAVEIQLVNSHGEPQYRMEVTREGGDLWGVGYVENITQQFSGQAERLYQEAAKFVESQGGKLMAGMNTNRFSKAVLERLEQSGEAERTKIGERELFRIKPAKPPPASSKDPIDKIPMVREDGTPTLVSARTAAKAGERETQFAELIRACQ